MDPIRDKFLTEAMGECYHKEYTRKPYHDNTMIAICKCGDYSEPFQLSGFGSTNNPIFSQYYNFSTWEGFGVLWKWVWTQRWYYDFKSYCNGTYMEGFMEQEEANNWEEQFIDPDVFANKLYMFLKRNSK